MSEPLPVDASGAPVGEAVRDARPNDRRNDRRRPLTDFFRRLLRRQPLGAAAGVVLLGLVFVAIFAEQLTPHVETRSYQRHSVRMRSSRRRPVVSIRSSRLAATSSVKRSHASASRVSERSKPFSLRNTRQVASATRLLPSRKG